MLGGVTERRVDAIAVGAVEPFGPVARATWDPLAAVARSLNAEREQWFTWSPVLFGLGICAYFELRVEPELWMAIGLAALVLAARLAVPRDSLTAVLATAALLAALGFLVAKVRTDRVAAPVLTKRISSAEVAGFVELVEPKPSRGGRLTLRLYRMRGPDGDLGTGVRPLKIRVRTLTSLDGWHPGDAVTMRASLAPPPAPAIPGGYDFGRAAWFQGLGAVGYGLSPPEHDATAPTRPWTLGWTVAVERIRQAIGARIVAGLPGETGAIANALITGERGAISDATNDAYRNSGLFHALSISGLHMAVMAGAIFWSLRVAMATIPALALRYPIKKWAAVGAGVGALFYLLISGSSPPTERSYLMISIMFIAIILDRQALALRNVAISAFAILAFYPESLFDLGFQMSYAAVGALIAAAETVRERRRQREAAGNAAVPSRDWALGGVVTFFGGIALSTVIASLATAPFGAYYFHKSQQYGILGNVLGLPICDIYIMPLALAVLVAMPFGLEQGPLWLMGVGVDALTGVAKLVGALPGANVEVPATPEAAFALIVAGGIWLALWRTRWRFIGLAAIIGGLMLAPFGPRPDILIGEGGRAVAIRLNDGKLSALPLQGKSFDLGRWLESDGDARPLSEVASGAGFRCDGVGCFALVKGVPVAIAARPAALSDDCARAKIVVLPVPRPKGCTGPAVVIEPRRLRRKGPHALTIGRDGAITVETVADARGMRPWALTARGQTGGRAPTVSTGRLRDFTAIARLLPGVRPPRPDDEDDDGEDEGSSGTASGPDGRAEPRY